jgi:hypothetical protein
LAPDIRNGILKTSIERMDNNGNYEPNNIKHATRTEQVRNRRVTIMTEYKGKVIPLASLYDYLANIHKPRTSYAYFRKRRHYWKWSLRASFMTPHSHVGRLELVLKTDS